MQLLIFSTLTRMISVPSGAVFSPGGPGRSLAHFYVYAYSFFFCRKCYGAAASEPEYTPAPQDADIETHGSIGLFETYTNEGGDLDGIPIDPALFDI